MKKILQVNFKFSELDREITNGFQSAASRYDNDVKGFIWKIWLVNQDEKTGSGILLFKDEICARTYLDSEMVSQLRAHPNIRNVEGRVFDILPEFTKITHGPVE